MKFHICGYYKNPLVGIANVCEEIYCSRSFIENYNPGLFHENQNIYVKLKEDVSREKAYEILQDINSEIGGDGVAMKMGSTGSARKFAAAEKNIVYCFAYGHISDSYTFNIFGLNWP